MVRSSWHVIATSITRTHLSMLRIETSLASASVSQLDLVSDRVVWWKQLVCTIVSTNQNKESEELFIILIPCTLNSTLIPTSPNNKMVVGQRRSIGLNKKAGYRIPSDHSSWHFKNHNQTWSDHFGLGLTTLSKLLNRWFSIFILGQSIWSKNDFSS